jgi:DNA-binding MarR family transcriptional regulator
MICQSRVFLANALKPYGISKEQYLLILHVCDHPGISQNELAESLEMNKGSISKAVKNLIKNGFLRRESKSENNRAYKLYAKESAQKIYPVILGIVNDWYELLMDGFSEENRIQYYYLLWKVYYNSMKYTEADTEQMDTQ